MSMNIKYLLLVLCLPTITAGEEFYNVATKEHAAALPSVIKVNGNVIFDPRINEASQVGWRIKNVISNAPAGTVAYGITWVDSGGTFATAVLTTRTQAEQDALDAAAAAQQAAQLVAYKDRESTPTNWIRIERAAIELLVDENNALRQWLVDFKVQVAAASTLADLKTRVATLPNMPVRTAAQIKTALRNKLDTYPDTSP